ncbi:hypothetical protein ACFWJ4_22885, partial [Kitasatospora sp. NPDC127067]|uniref:hypothetical protein n=1 Tax=Kitasatospora sp. NPDC127067 TaxID=3347126 RepID=UPI003650CC6F
RQHGSTTPVSAGNPHHKPHNITTVSLDLKSSAEWLAERGLTGPRDVQAELAVREAEEDRRRLRWLQAAPAGLHHAAMAVSNPPGRDLEAWSDRLRDAEAQLAMLVHDGYSDGIERIRALLAWAGVPARESTGGLKWYDLAV